MVERTVSRDRDSGKRESAYRVFWPRLDHRIAAASTITLLLAMLAVLNIRGVKMGT